METSTNEGLLIHWWRHWLDPTVHRNSLFTSLFIGTVLVGINQWEYFLHLEFSSSLLAKIGLTYLVPYLVSSFSAVRAQLRLEVGSPAPADGRYRCESCLSEGNIHDEVLSSGETLPECERAGKHTSWTLVSPRYHQTVDSTP
jgi:hypothetical protein